MRPYWRYAVGTVVLTVLIVLVSLLGPWPLQILFDYGLGNHPLPPILEPLAPLRTTNRVPLVIIAVLAGFLLTLLQNALEVWNSYVKVKLEQRVIVDIRNAQFEHALRLHMGYHDQNRAGLVIYIMTTHAESGVALVMSALPLGQSFLTLLGMFGVMFTLNWQIALLASIVVPPIYYAIGYYAHRIQPRLLEVRCYEADILAIIHEVIGLIRVVTSFGRAPYEAARLRAKGDQACDARVRITVRQTLFSLAVNTITALGTALVLGWGAILVLRSHLTGGELLVILSYIGLVYKPLESISYTIGALQENLVGVRITFEFLDTEPEIKDPLLRRTLKQVCGDVRFENVSFRYTGRSDTLCDISLSVCAGQTVAIVGPTGAGKTTLMSLLLRLYQPSGGRILIDNVDITRVTLASLRQQISVVGQEPMLFSGTVAENIRYGRFEATDEEVVAAARAANAHDFIMGLPNQYDTVIGERGAQLSGGERQRLCIARAFLKDAPILILDEPTSSIDSQTEAVILQALERLSQGRTTFMIAHRLSTIRHADSILVMDAGRLVEQGCHDVLMQHAGLYRRLYDLQIGSTDHYVYDL